MLVFRDILRMYEMNDSLVVLQSRQLNPLRKKGSYSFLKKDFIYGISITLAKKLCFKGAVIQIEKALINNRLHVSKYPQNFAFNYF